MKALFLFFTILFCTNVFCQSRCEKGTWIAGVNVVNYGINRQIVQRFYADTLVSQDTSIRKGIGFVPYVGIGYFVKNNFFIGAGFGGETVYAGSIASLALPSQIIFRYYLMQKKYCFSFAKETNLSRHALFVEGILKASYTDVSPYNAQNTTQKGNIKTAYYGGNMGLGYTYLFSKHIAMEIMGMYYYSTIDTRATSNTSYPSSGDIQTISGFILLLGIQTYF